MSLTEFVMPMAATTNTIPMLYWFFLNVFTRPELVAIIRDEVAAVTILETDGEGTRTAADVDVSRLEKGCPTLFACYRETLRLYSDVVGNRRVMEDTTLRDPTSGAEYLLRKGINVQWAGRLTHALEPIWGDDVKEFKPERWIGATSADEKGRRGAMIPFGGGKTLCPGRYFAQAELLGFVAALALGFEVEVEGGRAPEATVAYLGTAVKRPV
ncbi:cytochrome P450, partial [Candidatus Bathyarchaeota archaeon]|nr:cytochrome P450 [Candidatus Bathyarchaeota archaeon]